MITQRKNTRLALTILRKRVPGLAQALSGKALARARERDPRIDDVCGLLAMDATTASLERDLAGLLGDARARELVEPLWQALDQLHASLLADPPATGEVAPLVRPSRRPPSPETEGR